MTKKIVRWEKWVDPFKGEESKDEPERSEGEYMDSYEKTENESKRGRYSGPVLVGPMGVVPLNDGNSPSKLYNFWTLHSNFNISKPVVKALKEHPGVESLDVFTRYRARIGFGKVFDDERVRNKIRKMLCEEKKKEAAPVPITVSPLDMLKKQMSDKYKFWAIATTKTNEFKLFGGDTQEFVQTKVSENEYVKVHKSWE